MARQPAQTDAMVAAVAAFVDGRRMLAPGEAAIVGVSGGPDSVALLAVLRELAAEPTRGYCLTVAHLNHRLRPTAEDDARFVAELAAGWSLPCIVEARDVRALAEREGQGIESAARTARYEFLAAAAAQAGASAVAVGHHADDHVETILHRILRGTHLRGLAGIPAERPLAGGIRLIRPLLAVRRAEIEDFCRRRGLGWRTDETNIDPAYRRNFIRHELLPLLRRQVGPAVDEALLRLAAVAAGAEACLGAQGAALLGQAQREGGRDMLALDAAALAVAGPVPRTYALRAALEALGVPLGGLTARHLAALAELPGAAPPAAVALPGGWVARREGPELLIEPVPPRQPRGGGPGPAAQRVAPPAADWQVPLAIPGTTDLPDGRQVTCHVTLFRQMDFVKHCISHPPGVELLDAHQVRGRLICRPWRPGDAFMPLGAPGRRKVSDILTNLKLPRRARCAALCIADEEGIVYLAPLRIADRVRIGGETRSILRIELSA